MSCCRGISLHVFLLCLLLPLSAFPQALPIEVKKPFLEVVQGGKNVSTSAPRPKGPKNLRVGLTMAGCLVGVDALHLKSQQKLSSRTCLVHTEQLKPTQQVRCNGNAKDCPFGNYYYAHRIEPVVQKMKIPQMGFALPRAPTTQDFANPNGEGRKFLNQQADSYGTRAKGKHNPFAIFNQAHDSGNSEGEAEGGGDDDDDIDILAVLPMYKLTPEDYARLHQLQMPAAQTENSLKALISMRDVTFEVEKSTIHNQPVSKSTKTLRKSKKFSDPYLTHLRRLNRTVRSYIILAGDSLMGDKDYTGFIYALTELQASSKRLEKYLSTIQQKYDGYQKIDEEIHSTWKNQYDFQDRVVIPKIKDTEEQFVEMMKELLSRKMVALADNASLESKLVIDVHVNEDSNPDTVPIRNIIWSALKLADEDNPLISFRLTIRPEEDLLNVEIVEIVKGRLPVLLEDTLTPGFNEVYDRECLAGYFNATYNIFPVYGKPDQTAITTRFQIAANKFVSSDQSLDKAP